MKNLRQLCVAIVLTLAVAAHTFAGDMHTLAADPPPPPPSSAVTDGEMTTMVAGQMETTSGEAIEPITQIALNILQSVLSLF